VSVVQRLEALDRRLLAVPRRLQYLIAALTVIAMAIQALPSVPRAFVDYSRLPILRHLSQPDTFGTDTIGDGYEARVVLNDPRDMYTKAKLEQTPEEAATWSKAASAPYPPAVLLAEAGLYRLGQWTGLGFYGMILLLAAVFIGWSLRYFLATRWYVFPLLYLNFSYFGYRFVFVQDCTYLVMLVVVMAALWMAKARRPFAHALMALAIAMKITPLYYAKNLLTMGRRTRVVFVTVITAGLVLPYFIWPNYLYIFAFHEQVKGDWLDLAAAIGWALPFAAGLWYVETKLHFDLEDRIGWGLVPASMFLAMKMNVPRHLLIALLVPDKRGLRNLALAFALALQALFPGTIRFGSTLSIVTVLLFGILFYYLHIIGWSTIRRDVRFALGRRG
jgi:hypothetical protein